MFAQARPANYSITRGFLLSFYYFEILLANYYPPLIALSPGNVQFFSVKLGLYFLSGESGIFIAVLN